ncbi:hypothetical protein BU17DRAFT_80026 [Hysterangium stoloniferum]|nr:hypothetical protein BU17DRAFT_80026 [Hysterangium stoloniferum]
MKLGAPSGINKEFFVAFPSVNPKNNFVAEAESSEPFVMANASAKRIAAQNEKAIQNLQLGMVLVNTLSILIRVFFQKRPVSFIWSFLRFILPSIPTVVLSLFIVRAGTPKRDSAGTLLSPGDDLNQAGLLEWSWDVIYITWACQIGSSLLGEWVWWLYLIIPSYVGYKVWSSFISPIFLGRSSVTKSDEAEEPSSASKRQEKLRKRQAKGDPRVRIRQ